MIRPNLYPVQVKTIEQQDIQAIHRVRNEIKAHRVAKGNQIRGLVSEYGLVIPRELSSLRKAIPIWLDDTTNSLTSCFKQLLRSLWDDLRYLDDRMKELNNQIKKIAQQDPIVKRLQQLQGVGAELASTHPDYELFSLLPGARNALAPRLLVAFSEQREHFKNASELQRYSGIAPVTERSAQKHWAHWRWKSPTFLRQTFVEWAAKTINKLNGMKMLCRLSQLWSCVLAER